MSDQPEPTVIGSLPRSRPQRRSAKRAARPESGISEAASSPERSATSKATTRPRRSATSPAGATPKRSRAAAPKVTPPLRSEAGPKPPVDEPVSTPLRERPSCPASLPGGTELAGTVIRAAAELAEIGLTVGARALRSAVARLPRP